MHNGLTSSSDITSGATTILRPTSPTTHAIPLHTPPWIYTAFIFITTAVASSFLSTHSRYQHHPTTTAPSSSSPPRHNAITTTVVAITTPMSPSPPFHHPTATFSTISPQPHTTQPRHHLLHTPPDPAATITVQPPP
nr:hypothetical protein [Tanacetum cinerariifolium]